MSTNTSTCRYLRSLASEKEDTGEKAVMLNAADEIERLERQRDELLEALEMMVGGIYNEMELRQIMRQAINNAKK